MQHYPPLAVPHRVYVLDDHQLVAELLAQRLAVDRGIEVVGLGRRAEDARHAVTTQRVDILLLDMQLEDSDGIALARELLTLAPRLRIIGLSAHHDTHYPQSLLEAGGRGFIAKKASSRELLEGIRRVARGDLAIGADVAYHFATAVGEAGPQRQLARLTEKEFDVFTQIARGHSLDEISAELGITLKTVQSHRSSLRRKLRARNDVELCLLALRAGCLQVHEAR